MNQASARMNDVGGRTESHAGWGRGRGASHGKRSVRRQRCCRGFCVFMIEPRILSRCDVELPPRCRSTKAAGRQIQYPKKTVKWSWRRRQG